MNYDNTKIYGTIVNEMATEFNKGHDIYESAAVLPKYVISKLDYSLTDENLLKSHFFRTSK